MSFVAYFASKVTRWDLTQARLIFKLMLLANLTAYLSKFPVSSYSSFVLL